jgi:hypothetical protein
MWSLPRLFGEAPTERASALITEVRHWIFSQGFLKGFHGISSDLAGFSGISWDFMGFNGIQWDLMGFKGI